jgi:hypothetical protein
MSMMLLISSRIIFTFSDVGDSGKEVVAVLLIVFLVVILARTIGETLRQRVTRSQPFLITPGVIESLEPEERAQLGQAMLEYQVLNRRRAMELDQDFALNSTAAKLLFQKKVATTNNPNFGMSRVRIVSIPLSPSQPPATTTATAPASANVGENI